MALEEKDIMQHRVMSEKIQVIMNTLVSGVIKKQESTEQIEDMLTSIILEYGKQD